MAHASVGTGVAVAEAPIVGVEVGLGTNVLVAVFTMTSVVGVLVAPTLGTDGGVGVVVGERIGMDTIGVRVTVGVAETVGTGIVGDGVSVIGVGLAKTDGGTPKTQRSVRGAKRRTSIEGGRIRGLPFTPIMDHI